MNNQRVNTLHYNVLAGDNVDYDKAAPITDETKDFKFSIDSQHATFEMKVHCSNLEEAKTIVDSFLRKCEVIIGLDNDPGDLRFIFDRAHIIDCVQNNSGSTTINVHSCLHAICSSINLVCHVSRDKFPNLSQQFEISPDVETMFNRYKAFRESRESLLSMAYMCLTVLEVSAGGRQKAAKKYSIDKDILRDLGVLCSVKGSPQEARKTPRSGVFSPLSNKEKEWVIKVVKAIILRVGEYAYNPKASLPIITKANFPSI